MAVRVVSIISRMNVGGPAVILSELIRNLPFDQFQHTLVTGRCQVNEIDYLADHPLDSEVIYIDEIGRSILPTADLKSFFKLIKELKRLQPDVVHTHTSKAGALGRLAAKIAVPKAKIIHTYHGHLLYGYFPNWKTSLVIQLEKLLSKITYKFIGVTSQVKIDLIEVGIGPSNKWVVIPPGVNPGKEISKSAARESMQLDQDKFVVAWIGRFTAIKNPMLALMSLQNMSEIKQLKLVMAGAGELLEDCRKYATDKGLDVDFLGWVSDVNSLLSSCDLLLLTSRNEGMPVVVVEAAYKGVPTISTDVGGVSDFITDQETGFLVSSNAESVSSELNRILSDNSLLLETGLGAFRKAEINYTVKKMVSDHIELYLKSVGIKQ